MSYEAPYALKCSLFKKIVKNQFFALRVHKKQFLANISKTERFSMYVASYHLYKCDHCAHFGVFEKSLRPSGAELAFLPNRAKRAWPPWVFPIELSLTKLFGGSRYLIQSIHAKKLQVRIFSRLGWISPLLVCSIVEQLTAIFAQNT